MTSSRAIPFVIAMLAGTLAAPTSATVPTVERDALIAFYTSTNGSGWIDNSNWRKDGDTDFNDPGTECTWKGVFCNPGDVTVVALFLSSNGLSGPIPAEIEDLANLLTLDLQNNQVNGSIPAEIGNLGALDYIYLHQNQLSGSIPPSLGNLSNLLHLFLEVNQLTGPIPPALGGLSNLEQITLAFNQLSGPIPVEFGTLGSLEVLRLHANQLTGPIPSQLGNLSSLDTLFLSGNRLFGSIPSALGSLSSLLVLHLSSNQLSGSVPVEISTLASLTDGLSDFRWNALHSDNPTVVAFLNQKQNGGDWQSTQTVAPENVAVTTVGDHTAWLSWDAVAYQTDPGGYEVFSAPMGSGSWTSGGWTEAKTEITFPVTGLNPQTDYDFALVSYTDPHANNQNLVNSDLSSEEMATTANDGCAQPVIDITWGDPIVLSVPGSYDSYLWNTGATTSSININPSSEQWYWVRVTSTGPCDETAALSVGPDTVFADGFESGDTTAWSSSVP